jgi:hypothetical protein
MAPGGSLAVALRGGTMLCTLTLMRAREFPVASSRLAFSTTQWREHRTFHRHAVPAALALRMFLDHLGRQILVNLAAYTALRQRPYHAGTINVHVDGLHVGLPSVCFSMGAFFQGLSYVKSRSARVWGVQPLPTRCQ